MKYRNYFTTLSPTSKALLCVLAALIIAATCVVSSCRATDEITCWILCRPGSKVNVRRTPERDGIVDGYLEVGDAFRTDGRTANGFIHAIGVGESWDAWVWCGYVVTERPEEVYENYVCVSNSRVVCRQYVDGPQVKNHGYLVNGSTVSVFYTAEGWACTNRGYIRTEWLERDP